MKNKINNLILVVSSLIVASFVFAVPTSKAFASVDLDVNGHEAPNVYQLSGRNYTDNPGSTVYGRTVNADAGDTIKLQIHYHNFTTGQNANNVKMAISVPSGSGTSFTINSNLWADNSVRTYADTVTINLSSTQSLQFVSGSVVWYPGFSGATTLPNGQSGDTVTSSGVNVGTVVPGNSTSGYIYLRLLVSNTTSGSAPSVTTNSATSVGQTSATLNSTVNPNGASTNTWFEYGSTSSLGNTTSSQSAGSGTSASSFTQSLTGLSSNTTYYFRAVAQNSYGTTYGSTLNFTTSAAGSAPTVTTNSATSIGQTSATFNGSVNPNSASTNAWFEYGTSNSLGNQTSSQSIGSGSSSVTTNYSVSGLSSNTTYYFRAVASNTYGTTYGSILSFTTGASGSAPSVTTNSATSVGQTSANLNGSVNPNSASTNYWFEYGSTSSLGSQTSSQSAGSGSSSSDYSYALSGLSQNTTYYFRVVASNTYGTTYGSTLSFTTSGTSGSAPSVTTNSATSIGQTSATLNSTVNPNNSSTNTWFEYGSSSSLGYQTSSQSAGSGSSSSNYTYSLSGLAQNTTYYFRAVAQNSYGTTYGSTLSFTTSGSSGSAPTVVTNSATNINDTWASLNGSVNPNSASTNYWFEYGSTSSLGSQTSSQSAGSGSSSSNYTYSLSGLSNNTTYYFRIVASNSYGTTYGSTLSFTTSGSSSGNTPIVSTDSATGVDAYSATLRGTVNPNNSYTYTYFEYGTSQSNLSNRTSEEGIGSSNSNVSISRNISGLSGNTTYYYRAVARNSYGTTYGSTLSFYTSSGNSGCSPTVVSNSASFLTENSASLRGTVNPNGRDTSGWFEYGTNTSLGTRTSYQTLGSSSGNVDLIRYLSSLSSNTTYYYRAVAENSCGVVYGSTLSFSTTGSTDLPLVDTLTASNLGQSYATLNGQVNPGNSDATAWFEWGTDQYLNNYSVTSSSNVGSGNYMRSISTPINGLSTGTRYYFRAVARNNMGTTKGMILSFVTGGYNPPTPTYGDISVWKEVKNLTFPNGTQYVNASSIGDVLEYALTVKNIGNSTINSVTVKDTISSYYDIVESNPTYTSNGGTGNGNQLVWTLNSISPNENRVIYVKVKARTVEQSVVIYNSFTATAGTTRTSNKTTTILNPSMMAMDISADKGVVDRNGTFFYNIRYRNIGINDVDNVVIKFSMPESVTFVSSTPSPSSSDANVYFYRIGRVSRGQVGTISIQARVNKDTEIGVRQIATAVLDYNDIFGTPQRNISVSSAIDVGSGAVVALAAAAGFAFGGAWWTYLLWLLIILLILAIVYLYFKISKLLKNNY